MTSTRAVQSTSFNSCQLDNKSEWIDPLKESFDESVFKKLATASCGKLEPEGDRQFDEIKRSPLA